MTPGRRQFGMLLACVLLLASCGEQRHTFSLLVPAEPFDREVAAELAEVFESNSRHRIELVPVPTGVGTPLEAIEAGYADLALASNAQPYRESVTTVMPLYPTVLHIMYLEDLPADSPASMLRGASVNAGSPGSASRQLFAGLLAGLELGEDDVRFVGSADELPDVNIVFLPIWPEGIQRVLAEYGAAGRYRFLGLGTPEEIGTGSAIDRAVLLNPRVSPFVIPKRTYGDIPEDPVVTLAVDKLLVSRPDLDAAVVYDLIAETRRLQPALAARRPMLFRRLTEEFDAAASTFVLHPGAQAYMQRDTPTFYERYSGVAEVLVTLIIGLVSGGYAVVQIYNRRRKNRIDGFYTDVMAVRDSIGEHSTADDRAAAVERVRELQNTAFDMLIREKLAADESFRIFVTLSNDIIEQLTQGSSRRPTAAAADER
jgi:TRAP-type uncharacterized transport system substrate-binding protein